MSNGKEAAESEPKTPGGQADVTQKTPPDLVEASRQAVTGESDPDALNQYADRQRSQ